MVDAMDRDGIKTVLPKGAIGYDDYAPGGDVGRIYIGTGTANIPLAKKDEAIKLPNTNITDATTLDWYEEATATLTVTGVSGSITCTVKLTRVGNTVTLTTPDITETSNATTFTLTGVPINFRPSALRGMSFYGKNNNVTISVQGFLDTAGTITLIPNGGTYFGDWIASGWKTLTLTTVLYHI